MRYLLFVRTREDGERLASGLGAAARVDLVLPGPGPATREDRCHWLAPAAEADYQRLFDNLAVMPDRILYAWPWAPETGEMGDIDAALQLGVAGAFLLAKALITRKPSAPLPILYVHAWRPGEGQPLHEAAGAFARTVSQESMKVTVKAVGLDTGADAVLADHLPSLLREWAEHPDDREVRYQAGQRRRRVLKEVSPTPVAGTAAAAAPASTIRDGGVYLITGGTGGLGFIVARHLASRRRIHLALCGRRPRDGTIDHCLEDLKFLGAQASYYAVDVADAAAVSEMIADIRRNHGPLTGIIHAAGINRDALITRKPLDDFHAVLRPKLHGTLALDEATRSEPLELVVYFSSIAGLMGNIGQADYAYANAFLDSHARQREARRLAGKRAGRTMAINWPLWRDGGMKVDDEVNRFAERTLGMAPLSVERGLALFDRMLGLDLPQVFGGHGDRARAGRWFGLEGTAPVSVPAPAAPMPQPVRIPEAAPAATSDTTVLKALQDDLVKGVVEILAVDPKDADMDTDLNQFGFDSLTFTTFGNRITEALRIDINPVVFFEYNTVRELSEHFFDAHREDIFAWYQREKQPVAATQSPASAPQIPPVTAAAATARSNPVSPAPVSPPRPMPPPTPMAAAPVPTAALAEEPIAIIGIDGILPQSADLEIFWEHLHAGADLVTEIPAERWDWRSVWGNPFEAKNRTQIKWGGFVPDVDKFDEAFFGISAREAERMDPQHRLFLQTVWHCIEDAGYRPSRLAEESTVGLFCGSASVDYHDIMAREEIDVDVFAVTGTMFSVLVNRISYLLNFRGPSEPVETACSSSLVALHRAIQSIRAGECDVAIAGGVHLMLGPSVHIGLDKGGFLSPRGRCATFDKEADGYTRGEGCVAVLLKPLSKALADGDPIHARIIGSAVNHGGRVNTLTTPNPNAQTEVIVKAWRKAGVDPRTISYIEAHGTGTALGDPIEVKALGRAFDALYDQYGLAGQPRERHCGIGSVKTNIGHLEFVAGVSGLAKIVLAMRHRTLPASIHYSQINPYIDLGKGPLHIIDSRRPWTRPRLPDGTETPLRAGVSSFGFGGVNCHMALEEHWPAPVGSVVASAGPWPFLLSARTPEALARVAARLRARLEQDPGLSLADVAYTLAVGREPLAERLVIIAADRQELLNRLSGDLRTTTDGRVWRSNRAAGQKTLGFLKSNEEARLFARTVQERGQLAEMAGYWTDGLDLDWAVADLVRGRRVRLPGYPFDRTRHWIAATKPPAPARTENAAASDTMLEAEIKSMLTAGLLTREQARELLDA